MKDLRNFEHYLIEIILAVLILIGGYFGSRLIVKAYTGKLMASNSASIKEFNNGIKNNISNETDAYRATKLGVQFTNSQNDELALVAFQKATDLNPGYRDAWVWRADEELKLKEPREAIISLQKAEAIDPTNARTYELYVTAYKQLNDTDKAQKAKEKWEYLKKASD